MPGDPYWSSVAFLSGFEGGSVVDESPLAQTVTLSGSAAASTGQAKFGTKSLYRSSNSGLQHAQVPANSALPKGSDQFTAEGWFYFTSLPSSGDYSLLGQLRSDSLSTSGWSLGWYKGPPFSNALQLYVVDSGGSQQLVQDASWTPTLNTWYHIAADFDGTKYRLYVDGVHVSGSSGTTTYAMPATVSEPLTIGTVLYTTSGDLSLFLGYVDEARVTTGVARYASDSGFTPLTAAFERGAFVDNERTIAEGIGMFGACGLGDTYLETLTQGIGTHQLHIPGWPKSLSDTVQIVDPLAFAQGANIAQSIGAHDALSSQIALLLAETFRTVEVADPTSKYQLLTTDAVRVTEALIAGWAMTLSDTITSSAALTAARGVVVAESLGLLQGQVASAVYQLSALERALLADSLGRCFGGDLSDSVGLSEALGLLRKTSADLMDGAGIHDEIAPRFLIQVTAADTVGVSATQALRMLFSPDVIEGVEISAGYVAPSGSITTWAMNTSTGAVTEYRNYAFNSFAKLGNRYVGASDSGLYELSGDSDDGTDIIAEMKSGFMQFAGAKHALLKRVYMATRGDGDFVLKVVTGEGQEYHYGVTTTSMRTTKVHLGKGLRARYFAFELISEGQDFDLESLEFVPIAAQRRV